MEKMVMKDRDIKAQCWRLSLIRCNYFQGLPLFGPKVKTVFWRWKANQAVFLAVSVYLKQTDKYCAGAQGEHVAFTGPDCTQIAM